MASGSASSVEETNDGAVSSNPGFEGGGGSSEGASEAAAATLSRSSFAERHGVPRSSVAAMTPPRVVTASLRLALVLLPTAGDAGLAEVRDELLRHPAASMFRDWAPRGDESELSGPLAYVPCLIAVYSGTDNLLFPLLFDVPQGSACSSNRLH